MKNEHIIVSLNAELQLLNEIILTPQSFLEDTELFNALKSQKKFANYENPPLKIIYYSLNSHKEYINKFQKYNYQYLNELRVQAYNLLKQLLTNKDIKNSRKSLLSEINALRKHNILLTGIIMRLKYRLEHYAKVSNRTDLLADLENQNKEIESLLSLVEGY